MINSWSRKTSNQVQELTQTSNDRPKLQTIPSDRSSQIQINPYVLSTNNKPSCPLVFYFKIGEGYLISFKRAQLPSFLVKFVCISFFAVLFQIIVQITVDIQEIIRIILILLVLTQIVSFFLVFFIDAGTLFENQQQKMHEQRFYCINCKIYRSPTSKHCLYCNKCVKGYDHHCSFFGKCIGRQNVVFFFTFLITTSISAVAQMGSLFYTVFNSAASNNAQIKL